MSKGVRGPARICASLLLCVLALAGTRAQESASFKMKRLTVSPVAQRMASARFINTVTGLEIGGAAGVCPAGSASAVGFWSVLGIPGVPLVLGASRNAADPLQVDLHWTGQASEFGVYRSDRPDEVVSPGNLLVATPSCAATDPDAAFSDLIYYRVEPIPAQ